MSNAESNSGKPQTFWDHLEELRGCILRMLAAAAAAAAAAFGFKEELFGIVLAPADPDFITYRILGAEPFKFQLINTGLTEQFMIHLKTALAAGLLIASPYILYLLFRFVSPALYDNERRYSVSITLWAYAMFLMGVAVNYFVVFPLTVRFLGTYQVSAAVMNMLSISSYMDTLLGMSLVMGAVFEIPVISLASGPLRTSQGPLDVTLSPPRHNSDTHPCRRYNAYIRHVHHAYRLAAYMAAL